MEENIPIEKVLDLKKVKPVESQSVDLKKYDKKEVEIVEAQAIQVPSKFTAKIEGTEQHHMQWVLKISSEVLETIREGEDKIEFRASELFNLIQNAKGELTGFPTGEGSNLMKFAKDLRIDAKKLENLDQLIQELKGKKALVKSYDKEQEGRTKTYLKFRY